MFRSYLNKLRLSLPQSRRRVTASMRFRPRVEELENRLAPAVVTWVGGVSGSWAAAANWSTASLPGGGDDVVIDGAVTVSHAVGFDSIHTLSLGSGATLHVVDNSSITTTATGEPQVTNNGTIDLGDSGTTGNLFASGAFGNTGTVVINSGSTLLARYTQTGRATILQGGTLASFGPPPGNSLSFNGTSDFVEVPNSASLDSQTLTTQVTLEAWVYLNQLPSAAGHIMQIVAQSEVGNDLDLQVETDNRIHFYAGDEFPDSAVSNTVLQAGQWYHVAATYQAGQPGQLQIFVNGQLDATQSGNLARATNPNPLTIGASSVWPGRFFDGLITDVSVWNVVETQAQIQAEMAAKLQGTEPGLVGSWALTEGAGNIAHDATANHNDGSLGNGVSSQEPTWTGSPVASVSLQSGSLSGVGTVSGNLINSGGTVTPGVADPGGTITVNGSYTQGSAGTLDILVGGSSSGVDFGTLAVTGSAAIAGTLTVQAVDGYTPLFTDSYAALTFLSESGNFSAYNLPALGGDPLLTAEYVATGLVLTGTLSPTATTLASSANPSTYGQSVTLTATVTAASGNAPTGAVDFKDETTGQDLGTASLQSTGGLGQASVVVSGFTAGAHTIEAIYTTNNPGAFEDSSSSALSQVVNPATPVVGVSPVNLTYGTALANSQLSGTATWIVGGNTVTVAGTFAYTSAAGTVLGAGTDQREAVTFTPNDAADYTNAATTVIVNVGRATPTVTAPAQSATYSGSPQGFPTSAVTVTGANGLSSRGGALSFTYNGSGTAPTSAGTYNVIVTFTPNDATDYTSASTTTTWTINQATPVITWSNPSAIAFFAPLGSTQLDAAANVPGTFVYTPSAGTVLSIGTQTLSAKFTPADGTDYTTATATAKLVVLGPGVTLIGTQLYVVGGNTSNDQVQVDPAGRCNTGSTGVTVNASLNGHNTQTTYSQALTAIDIFLQGGNDNVRLAHRLTVNVVVTAGNGNDNIRLGNGSNVVTLGSGSDNVRAGHGNNVVTLGGGNDSVRLGGGNNTVTLGGGNDNIRARNGNNTVTAGNGNDNVTLGDGNNTVTLGNGNDNVTLGDGNNVAVTGNGNDSIRAGKGDNLIAAGLGQHTIRVGNGSNILIDGSAQLTQSGDSLRQVLNDWTEYGSVAANIASIRARLNVTYNMSHANTLDAGRGLDWFWEVFGRDSTNRKASDLLN